MASNQAMSQTKAGSGNLGGLCESCAGRRFRRSRLQWKDVSTLLSLHYPVRCLSCSKRQPVALAVARRALPSSIKQVRGPHHDGTPWSTPVAISANAVDPTVGLLELPKRGPITMPDLHGIELPHVAYVPPGSGENLAS